MISDHIEKKRTCDGGCCRVSPLRPIPAADGQDCYFRDPSQPEFGCTVIRDPQRLEEMTPEERAYFDEACLNWPQNATRQTQGSWGNCCWGWAG